MNDSLQSQFRGILVGAALGEILGFHCQKRLQAKGPFHWLEIDRWGWAPIQPMSSEQLAPQPVGWGGVVVDSIRQVIHKHQWDIIRPPRQVTTSADALAVAIATLPLALYFHEDLVQLRHHIHHLLKAGYPSEFTNLIDLILIPGYAIALILQRQTHPDCLIPELITELQLEQMQPSVAEGLTSLQTRLNQGMGLEQVCQQYVYPLSSSGVETALNLMAIVLYSILNTPEHYQLSVLQAARCNHYPQLICTLTGALSGAYNGLPGLPLSWRRSVDRSGDNQCPAISLWTVASVSELVDLADSLLASWAGIYNPTGLTTVAPFPIAATPGRMGKLRSDI